MAREIYVDRSRARAILITAAGNIYFLDEIESFTTQKSENGDAGTFSLTMPLKLDLGPANEISPMDIIAIYRGRVSTSVGDSAPIGANGDPFPTLGPTSRTGLTYGSSNASVTRLLQSDSCVMIGMVDHTAEVSTYEGNPSKELSISGRDLTKVFLDNDTYVPYTVTGSGPSGQNGIANLGNIVIKKDNSGTELLLNVLNVFCKKDTNAINGVTAQTQNEPPGAAALAEIAQYGYPWDNFVDQTRLDPAFKHFDDGNYPNFQVQSGSVWANVQELRNSPITRLFVNELGQLIFDDQFAAWTTQAPAFTIQPGDIRSDEFTQSDDDVATVISIVPSIMGMADTEIASLGQVGRARTPTEIATLQHFGYRWYEFQSQYDSAVNPDTIKARFKVIWLLRNSLFRANLIVRGDSKYRPGLRVALNYGGANPNTQFKTWYIVSVQHQYQYGQDDTTTLELRYPM